MIKTAILTAMLALGLSPIANAAITPVHIATTDGSIIQVGEGCGPGRWRGPMGGCHVFTNGAGTNRGTSIECPPGFHISYDRSRCMWNR